MTRSTIGRAGLAVNPDEVVGVPSHRPSDARASEVAYRAHVQVPPVTLVAEAAPDAVVVHLQLRPRVAVARRCLEGLAELAEQHGGVSFSLVGLSRDDRVVRFTLGIELGPREEIARFGPAAQSAYGFVNDVFGSLYDYMPVYTGEPSGAERAAAVAVLAAGELTAGPAVEARALESARAMVDPVARLGGTVPAPRSGVPAGVAAQLDRDVAVQELRRVSARSSAVA